MKILFLAGSLEPGKDGVGDYTRALAIECARWGHETLLVSINDPWIITSVQDSALLRLGTSTPWPDRAKALQKFLRDSRPDIVSLQFVPYAFHLRGLPLALLRILRGMMGHLPVQIMFHEIWIGAQIRAPLKFRAVGFFQRKIIKTLVKSLNCRVIHTSNLVYVHLLNRNAIGAKHLPLFGSVPVVATDDSQGVVNDNVLRLGLFGSIHPEWSPDALLTQLQKLGRPIQLAHIGRIGPGESVWMNLAKRYDSEIAIQRLGEQSLEDISRFFSSVHFGISTSPLSLIGKSSCVAAMLEHGLPVIVTRNDVHFAGISEVVLTSEQLLPLDDRFLTRITSVGRQSPKSRRPEIAAQFLRDVGA